MTSANALEQVIVQGRKPPVSMRFDRQVYKASEYNNATSGSYVHLQQFTHPVSPAEGKDGGGGM